MILPLTGQSTTLRPSVPHRVATALQEEAAKALKSLPPDVLRGLPTEGELTEEFGDAAVKALKKLSPRRARRGCG